MRIRSNRRGVLSLVVTALLATSICGHAADKRPLTVDDTLQMRRVLKGLYQTNDGVHLSPNRTRYLLMLVRDDLERNGTTLEILTGSTDSLDRAEPKIVTTLFTTSAADMMTGLSLRSAMPSPDWRASPGETRIV